MTTTKKVKPVTEKATTVVKKTTLPKPTIKSLQQEVTNLNEVLAAKRTLIDRLEFDILRVKEDNKALEQEITRLNASIRHRDEIILKLEVPFYRKIFNLFGN